MPLPPRTLSAHGANGRNGSRRSVARFSCRGEQRARVDVSSGDAGDFRCISTLKIRDANPVSPSDPDFQDALLYRKAMHNAIVQNHIYLPADVQYRCGRSVHPTWPRWTELARRCRLPKPVFDSAAIPDTSKHSGQTDRLYQRALAGCQNEIKALADWANVHDAENENAFAPAAAQTTARISRQLFEMDERHVGARAGCCLAANVYASDGRGTFRDVAGDDRAPDAAGR